RAGRPSIPGAGGPLTRPRRHLPRHRARESRLKFARRSPIISLTPKYFSAKLSLPNELDNFFPLLSSPPPVAPEDTAGRAGLVAAAGSGAADRTAREAGRDRGDSRRDHVRARHDDRQRRSSRPVDRPPCLAR